MTTTMVEMANVIKLFRKEEVTVPIMVGGAVLTRRYAEEIGADGYAKDAMEAVTKAKELLKRKNDKYSVNHEINTRLSQAPD
jgi:5-methyltetrahydrofolate--homocysteine methyltransferase